MLSVQLPVNASGIYALGWRAAQAGGRSAAHLGREGEEGFEDFTAAQTAVKMLESFPFEHLTTVSIHGGDMTGFFRRRTVGFSTSGATRARLCADAIDVETACCRAGLKEFYRKDLWVCWTCELEADRRFTTTPYAALAGMEEFVEAHLSHTSDPLILVLRAAAVRDEILALHAVLKDWLS